MSRSLNRSLICTYFITSRMITSGREKKSILVSKFYEESNLGKLRIVQLQDFCAALAQRDNKQGKKRKFNMTEVRGNEESREEEVSNKCHTVSLVCFCDALREILRNLSNFICSNHLSNEK